MLKSLSVVLTDKTRDRPALMTAATLARRAGAHLDIIGLGVMPVEFVTEIGPVISEAERVSGNQRANELAGWARSQLQADQRAALTTIAAPCFDPVETLTPLARTSDLAVTARPYGPGHGLLSATVAETLLFGSGVPLLVLPDTDQTNWEQPLRRMCLAWNDSNEAMRATRAALPFLQEAQEVEVAVIGPVGPRREGEGPEEGLLRWLDRHEVNARLTVLDRHNRRKAEVLAQFAADLDCQALVMGAYGHSRLREALLGGTTREMLVDVPLPILMAH